MDNGIKWRAMPADFPAWDRVYAFFRRWRDHRLVTEFHDRLRSRVRESEGRETEPTAAIVDSQSVKAAASVPAPSRGFDGAESFNGRKRHLIVDCLGLLLMVLVTPADVADRDAACGMLPRLLPATARSGSCGPMAATRAASSTGPGTNSASPWRSSSAATTCTASSYCPDAGA
ncbi:transposase [Streptomyces agglomeratus]|uniref:transposase n=1 Tax=Streptomyces agglomeratus TaxID=285458 RepID=UPI000ABEF4BA|nr:transposase [Streptomyces agglomeratus]